MPGLEAGTPLRVEIRGRPAEPRLEEELLVLTLPRQVATQRRRMEITWILAAIGALFAAGAVVAAMRWSPYPS